MSFNTWLDARLAAAMKSVIDEVSTDVNDDVQTALGVIDSKLDAIPEAISAAVGALISAAKTDVEQGIGEVPNLVNTVLGQGVLSVEQLEQALTGALNPQQLATDIAEAIKNISGGLLTKRKARGSG